MADIQATAPDPLYDLVGTLYHALKQAAAAERHAADAKRGRDTELAALFEDVREQSLDLAARCKTLLASRLGTAAAAQDQAGVEQASKESFPASDARVLSLTRRALRAEPGHAAPTRAPRLPLVRGFLERRPCCGGLSRTLTSLRGRVGTDCLSSPRARRWPVAAWASVEGFAPSLLRACSRASR
jgi:hypothetical protein